MLFQESESAGLKSIAADNIKKKMIPFANCNGGKLYIGRDHFAGRKGRGEETADV